MDQYGINCLSKAYESIPRQLADNSGNDPSKAISKLLAAHSALEGKLKGLCMALTNSAGNQLESITHYVNVA